MAEISEIFITSSQTNDYKIIRLNVSKKVLKKELVLVVEMEVFERFW